MTRSSTCHGRSVDTPHQRQHPDAAPERITAPNGRRHREQFGAAPPNGLHPMPQPLSHRLTRARRRGGWKDHGFLGGHVARGQIPQGGPTHARLLSRQRGAAINDQLVIQRLALLKYVDQHLPAFRPGGKAFQRTITDQTHLPQHRIGRRIDARFAAQQQTCFSCWQPQRPRSMPSSAYRQSSANMPGCICARKRSTRASLITSCGDQAKMSGCP